MSPPLTILSRPQPSGWRFAGDMRQRGIGGAILFAPVLQVVPLPMILPPGDLVFTSQNGVMAACASGSLRGRNVFAVGQATARAARAAGAEAVSADGDATALAGLIARRGSARVTHLHGRHVTGNLAGQLRAAGIPARGYVIYEQHAVTPGLAAKDALARKPCLVPVFSARSASLLGASLASPPANATVVSISAAAAAGWPWNGPVVVSATPDSAGLLDSLSSLVARGRDG